MNEQTEVIIKLTLLYLELERKIKREIKRLSKSQKGERRKCQKTTEQTKNY